MKKRLHTEHILLTSLAAILLCVVALAGTTYAWFFASVGSTNNTIKTGSMELALLREDENGQYQELSPDALTNGALFSANADGNGANWTAGHVEVVYLGLQNKGTIDDIYNVVVNAESGVGDMLEGLVIPFASAQEAASLQQNLIACDTNSQRWELLTSAAANSSAAIAQQSLTGAVTLLAGQPLPGVTEETPTPISYFALALHLREDATLETCDRASELTVSILAGQSDIQTLPGTAFIRSADELTRALADSSITNLVLRKDIQVDGTLTLDREILVTGEHTLTLKDLQLARTGSLTTENFAVVTITGGSCAGDLGAKSGTKLLISGGSFTGNLIAQSGAELTVTGGSFANDPSEFVQTDRYDVTLGQDGLWTVNVR